MSRLAPVALISLICAAQLIEPRALERLDSRADFDRLSRVHYGERFGALPHLMFVIDRADVGRIYYVNSRRYAFHRDFVRANYLTLEGGEAFYRRNYLEPDRRFLLGTIARRRDRFAFEFWEGDRLTRALLAEAYARLQATFFAPLFFKPNSPAQAALSETLDEVPRLSSEEFEPEADYVPLHAARAIGVLRIIDRLTEETIIDRNEIVIFREPPVSLTPLSGIITTTHPTPLAHVNLLARGWGIPNAYIRGADLLYAPLAGRFVVLETRADGYTLRPAETIETAEEGRRRAAREELLTPPVDLAARALAPLSAQRRGDARRYGAKSANLGEVMAGARAGRIRGITVPPGFTIPFSHYEGFLRANGLDQVIIEMLGEDRFNHDPAYRRTRLSSLRARIEDGRFDPTLRRAVIARKRALCGSCGVFVRSSTNAEDLAEFSGAGLYTTVPNVRDDEALMAAVKRVWASLWNYEAYEARERAGINHAAVYPAVLIQQGIDAEAAGVLITTNPFDREEQDSVYINAKRGLGIRVVEGRRVPEQIIYDPRTQRVRVLTRSGDDTMLRFDARGGVREVKIEESRAVLTDAVVRDLARAAREITQVFDGRAQDIEWVTVGSRLYIVQSRPFIEPR